jgi:uncharacterized repeat protein (TIGR03803 family)
MRNKVALMMTAAAILCTATSGEAAVKETTLYSFTGGNDGSFPHAGVIADAKGNFYGVTSSGGANHAGVIFELSPPAKGDTTWTQTTLYSFTGGNDGANPQAGLMMDAKGNLYGTTYSGGATGNGVVFELARHKSKGTWTYHTLWGFTGGNDGGVPAGSLTMDSAGNLYGTTTQGGTGVFGTVFELSPNGKKWSESVLYNFTGNNDGGEPMGNVLLGKDGDLYGTTAGYGQFNYGVVYKLTAQGGGNWGFSVLHAFAGGSDGEVPRDGLIQDANGTLYGATAGFAESYGNVFQMSTDGSNYNVIYSIIGGQGFTGNGPWQTVSLGADGTIYGTTYADGASSFGEVFQLTPEGNSWTSKVLYTFPGGAGGQYSYSKVWLDKLGRLYGTTYGVAGQGGFFPGTVWRIKP